MSGKIVWKNPKERVLTWSDGPVNELLRVHVTGLSGSDGWFFQYMRRAAI
jgi:hypothetical protein